MCVLLLAHFIHWWTFGLLQPLVITFIINDFQVGYFLFIFICLFDFIVKDIQII